MNKCKGICVRYKANKILKENRYINDQKRCALCGIFVYWDGVRCPCCGVILRTRPRKGIDRRKMIKALGVTAI